MNNSRFNTKDIIAILPKIIYDEQGIIEPIGALRSYNTDLCELSFEVPFYVQDIDESNDILDIKFKQTWPEFEASCGETWEYRLLIDIAIIESYIDREKS